MVNLESTICSLLFVAFYIANFIFVRVGTVDVIVVPFYFFL